MGDVLFVASTVELEHLAYADPRPALTNLGGHRLIVVADHQVTELRHQIARADAIVFGSNSLRSDRLRGVLAEQGLSDLLHQRLDAGIGIVVLHQLARQRADEALLLPFLPEPLAASPTKRPEGELSTSGTLSGPAGSRHESLLLPDGVELGQLESRLLHSGPNGLYWHYWTLAQPDAWRPIIVDSAADDRALVLESAGGHIGGRVILCSLPVDWVEGQALLSNIIHLAAAGNLDAAIVQDTSNPAAALVDLRLELAAQAHTPLVYDTTTASLERLAGALENGMHQSLLYRQGTIDHSSPLWERVTTRLDAGTLRVVAIPERSGDPVQFWSGETSFADEYQRALSAFFITFARDPEAVGLWQGVDGIWTTQREEGHAERCRALLQSIAPRVRDGAIDETPAPTAMFAWLTAGAGMDSTKSVEWLEGRIGSQQRAGDALRIGLWLERAGICTDGIRVECDAALGRVNDASAPVELLVALEYAIATDAARTPEIANLVHGIDAAEWDLGGTRIDLLVALMDLCESPEAQTATNVRAMSATARDLRMSRTESPNSTVHPLRRSAALARYERTHSLPMRGALVAAMGGTEVASVTNAWTPTDTVRFTSQVRAQVESMRRENAIVRRGATRMRRLSAWLRPIVATLVIVAYLLAAVLVGLVVSDHVTLRDAWDAIGDSFEIHLAIFLPVLAGLIAWIRSGYKKERTRDNLSETQDTS